VWLRAGPAQPDTVLRDICDLDVMGLCCNAKSEETLSKDLKKKCLKERSVSVLQALLSSPQQIDLSAASCGICKPGCDFAVSHVQPNTLQEGFFS